MTFDFFGHIQLSGLSGQALLVSAATAFQTNKLLTKAHKEAKKQKALSPIEIRLDALTVT
jgi:hypothetical protein